MVSEIKLLKDIIKNDKKEIEKLQDRIKELMFKHQDQNDLKEKFKIEKRSLKNRLSELSEEKHHLNTQIENLNFCLTATIKNLTDKFKEEQDEEHRRQAEEYYNGGDY